MNERDQILRILTDVIDDYGRNSGRTLQSKEGKLGPSDIGFCRNKAALMTKGVEQSDTVPINSAQLGTAIHQYLEKAFKASGQYDEFHWDTEKKVTAILPSGVEISGTADLIMKDWNAVIDVKTVDGFEWVKREGTSQNHKFQRHLYALGALQEGLLKEDGLLVGNLYIDRSGKEKEPYLTLEPFDPTLTDEIDSWIGDVIYAVKQGEDASRDIPAPVCQQICEFFTVCRGNLPVMEGGENIEDEMRIEAIKMYVDGREMEKTGIKMKKEAQSILVDSNGVALVDGERYQVRWTHINASEVAAFTRAASDRMDVRKVK